MQDTLFTTLLQWADTVFKGMLNLANTFIQPIQTTMSQTLGTHVTNGINNILWLFGIQPIIYNSPFDLIFNPTTLCTIAIFGLVSFIADRLNPL